MKPQLQPLHGLQGLSPWAAPAWSFLALSWSNRRAASRFLACSCAPITKITPSNPEKYEDAAQARRDAWAFHPINCPYHQLLLSSTIEVFADDRWAKLPSTKRTSLHKKHVGIKEEMNKERGECTAFQNSGPPLHCISDDFRNISVCFPGCWSMSAQTRCLMTVQKLSPLSYVSSLGTVTLWLSAFITSWLHWESWRYLQRKYWQQLTWAEATVRFISTNSQGGLSFALESDQWSCCWPIPELRFPRQRHLICLCTAPELPSFSVQVQLIASIFYYLSQSSDAPL